VKFLKKRPKEGFSYDRVAFLFINLAGDVVKDYSQELERRLDAQHQSLLPKVQEELSFFFFFALDYWWQTGQVHTREEKHAWGEIFGAHLRILFGGDPEGLAMFDTLQQRFIAYAEIVNKKQGDNAKFFGLGRQLSEFCGMPGNPYLLVKAPALFTLALESVSAFKRG